jgi:hypothetical protein
MAPSFYVLFRIYITSFPNPQGYIGHISSSICASFNYWNMALYLVFPAIRFHPSSDTENLVNCAWDHPCGIFDLSDPYIRVEESTAPPSWTICPIPSGYMGKSRRFIHLCSSVLPRRPPLVEYLINIEIKVTQRRTSNTLTRSSEPLRLSPAATSKFAQSGVMVCHTARAHVSNVSPAPFCRIGWYRPLRGLVTRGWKPLVMLCV